MMKIDRFGFSDKELLRISNQIRNEVFIVEQNVDWDLEYEFEEEANYYLLYYHQIPIATARWRETNWGIKLERFAMFKQYRNRGLGGLLLNAIMEDVLPLGKPIYLHSQITAVNYYKRSGFVEKGKHFFEANIEHVLMEYKNQVN